MFTDVLVIGAGPTGLMLANQLVRYGVRVHIIDRHAGPVQETRALGVQARTMEIYAKLGVVDRALAMGKRGTGANLWAEGRKMARVPIGDVGRQITPFPFIHILGQDDNERILGHKLQDAGVEVQWNTELTSLTQKPEGVEATLKTTQGATQVISAAWVAGCDGARSAVRQLNHIDFPGAPYEHVFFVADVEMTGTMVPDEVNVYLWKQGFHLFFPMRGDHHWRLVGIVPAQFRDTHEVKFEDVLPSVYQEAGAQLHVDKCTWFSTYRIHHRSASHFRAGRCFVLGDAAHIHSPLGAQGMNTGLQDAYNLGWKLAYVVNGHADAKLLDSYELERLPVAEHLLSTTDRAFRLVVSDSRLVGLLRTKVGARIAARAMRRERVQNAAFRLVSQIGIRYRHSPLSQSLDQWPKGAPREGDRFPWLHLKLHSGGPVKDLFHELEDTKFNLLVFGQAPPQAGLPQLNGLLQVHYVPGDPDNQAELTRAGIPSPAFYLVRPDGYVGLCGARMNVNAIDRYISVRLNMHMPPRTSHDTSGSKVA
jgi:2-polyprenyl-6-methoxyphenol hydroxylase-like FAD-dependent oxidoreductase